MRCPLYLPYFLLQFTLHLRIEILPLLLTSFTFLRLGIINEFTLLSLLRKGHALAILHFLIEIFACFLVLKIGQKFSQRFYNLGFGEVVFGKDGLELLEEGIHLGLVVMDGLLHYAKGLEARKVDLLARDVELFVGFLAGGVGGEVHRWVFDG